MSHQKTRSARFVSSISFLSLIGIVCLLLSVPAVAVPIQSGLVAHYPLEGTGQTVPSSVSATHNGFLGTTTGGDTNDPTRTTGFIGNGLDFESAAPIEVVSLPASNLFLSGASAPMTMAVWVNVESFTAGPSTNRIFNLQRSPSGGTSTALSVGSASGGSGKVGFSHYTGSVFVNSEADTFFATGGWHHIAATFDGTDLRLYLDGALDFTPLTTTIAAAGTDIGALGAFPTPSSGYDGLADDFGLWSRALSAAEIEQVYLSGLAGVDLSNAAFPQVPEPSSALLIIGLGLAHVVRRRKSRIKTS